MSTSRSLKIRLGWLPLLLLNVLFTWNSTGNLHAQIIDTGIQRAVGGVSIDAAGLLDTAQLDALGDLAKLRTGVLGITEWAQLGPRLDEIAKAGTL